MNWRVYLRIAIIIDFSVIDAWQWYWEISLSSLCIARNIRSEKQRDATVHEFFKKGKILREINVLKFYFVRFSRQLGKGKVSM